MSRVSELKRDPVVQKVKSESNRDLQTDKVWTRCLNHMVVCLFRLDTN